MSELICPKTGLVCENSQCATINAPLKDAVPEIKRQLGGASFGLVRAVLLRNINSEANSLVVDLYPAVTSEATTICPEEVLKGLLGDRLGVILAEQCMIAIAENCVAHTIADLKPRA